MNELDGQGNLESFMDKIDTYSADEFNQNFRIKRSTVDFLTSIYSQTEEVILPDAVTPPIDYRRDIHMYIWYVTHFMGYKELGDLFGVTRRSSEAAVRRVCHWLISIGHEHIKWPLGQDVNDTCRKFEQIAQIPGVIGAIECTRISVKPPKPIKHWYYKKQYSSYSIVLQVVVDADRKFIDICVGEPGSQRDITILRKSELYQRARSNFTDTFPGNTFILGDLAYAPSSWIIPPYRLSRHILKAQRNFNCIHTKTRIVVVNALVLLKERFHRLSMFSKETNLSAVTNLVASTCVLHNICIEKKDEYGNGTTIYYDADSDDEECVVENSDQDNPANRRLILFKDLESRNII